MLERVIFSIDDGEDLHTAAKFMRFVDTKRAMMEISPVEMCLGSYKGEIERSYMMLSKDFHHVKDWVTNQECFLLVPGDVRQPCVLLYPSTGEREPVGSMKMLPKEEALKKEAWTYFKGGFYVCE